MNRKVEAKQKNSKMCLVCGMKNSFGLKAFFYELDNGEVVSLFTPCEEHQSYPGRMHGGIACAILDETIGRAIMPLYGEDIWGVTIEFKIVFRKPIPLNVELKTVGRITSDTRRAFEGTGEIILPGGVVAAEGWGKYIKMPIEKISDFGVEEQEWKVISLEDDPSEIEI